MSVTVIVGLLGSFIGAFLGAKITKANALYSLTAVATATAILLVLQVAAFDELLSQIVYHGVVVGMAFVLGLRRWQPIAVLAGTIAGAMVFGFIGGFFEGFVKASMGG